MNKKCVFFDIDGTLWDSTNIIPESTAEAIKRLQAAGHKTFINTGRSRGFVTKPNLLELGFDGIVCGCGTMIEMGDEVVFLHEIDDELLLHVMEFLRDNHVYSIMEGRKYLYFDDFFRTDPYGQKVMRDMGENARSVTEEWGRWKVSKLSCVTTHADADVLHGELDKYFQFMSHTSDIAELVPIGFDKGTGILNVCKLTGCDPADTIAFGDSINDKEMMEAAGTAVAMGNGTEEIKKMSDLVTDGVYDDGILNACIKLGLI